jgi:NADH:ubiquinone oxidoreductase subunit 6 (subunit J)
MILLSQNPVSAVFLLIGNLALISLLLLVNDFVFFAFFMLSVYIGAVAIFFLFVLSIISVPIYTAKRNILMLYSVFSVFILIISFFFNIVNTSYLQEISAEYVLLYQYFGVVDSLSYLGASFFVEYSLFLIIITLLFLITMLGAMGILRSVV